MLKTERLLAIINYMINREKVTAKELADMFEVSVRTIVRDIDAIILSGIPIYSIQGRDGGFAIPKHFKIDKDFMSKQDFALVLSALKGLNTTLGESGIQNAYEKINNLSDKDIQKKLILDFSRFQGNENVRKNLKIIREAIDKKNVICFNYLNAKNEASYRKFEPYSIIFKWSSWYVLGFCKKREDFRMFKLSRIEQIEILNNTNFDKKDFDIDEFVEKLSFEPKPFIKTKLKFVKDFSYILNDIFNKEELEFYDDYIIAYKEFYNKNHMFAFILSFGELVEVIEPKEVRQDMKNILKNLLKKYNT